jgi:hypothetical protein
MNRKSVTVIFLIVSIIANVVFFVFAYVQKISADASKSEAIRLTTALQTVQQQSKAELDQCEGLRDQSDEAREECERKLLTISNRK